MKKILVIDDDESILDAIRIILEQEGYTVFLQSDVSQIVKVIQKLKPDLILLDVMLGITDGRDICRQIKKHRYLSSTPVIMVTATKDMRNVIDDFVPDGYIAKPFDMAVLVKTIQRHLQGL